MRARLIRFAPLAIIAWLGLPCQIFYVHRSSGSVGKKSRGLAEVPYASVSGLLSELGGLRADLRRPTVVSDATHMVLAKLEGAALNPASIRFPAADYFEYCVRFHGVDYFDHESTEKRDGLVPRLMLALAPAETAQAIELLRQRKILSGSDVFFTRSGGQAAQNRFFQWKNFSLTGGESYDLAASTPAQSPLNRWHADDRGPFRNVRIVPFNEIHNHLLLVASELGGNLFIGGPFGRGRGTVSLYQAEPDYFLDGRTLFSVGRYLLFALLHPEERVRFALHYTASLNADGENRIPAVTAIGDTRTAFATAGRGAGRLFSPVVRPQLIHGQPYLMLDMGQEAKRFPNRKQGLMKMYGEQIPLDTRSLVGFVRDISLISDQQYESMKAPAQLQRLPEDLANRNLEYSGSYEDGWISEEAYFVLRAPAGQSQLRLKGLLPRIGTGTSLSFSLLVDGVVAVQKRLPPGEFDILAPGQLAPGKHRIQLRADHALRLPPPDNRQTAFLLRYLGFETPTRAEIADPPVTIREHWYPFETYAGDTFRWVANDALFSIDSSAAGEGSLKLEVSSGPGLEMKPFILTINDGNGRTRAIPVAAGRQNISVPAAVHRGTNTLRLHIEGGGKSTPNDPRTLNFRVFRITWELKPSAQSGQSAAPRSAN